MDTNKYNNQVNQQNIPPAKPDTMIRHPPFPWKKIALVSSSLIILALGGIGFRLAMHNTQRKMTTTAPVTHPQQSSHITWKTYEDGITSLEYSSDWTVQGGTISAQQAQQRQLVYSGYSVVLSNTTIPATVVIARKDEGPPGPPGGGGGENATEDEYPFTFFLDGNNYAITNDVLHAHEIILRPTAGGTKIKNKNYYLQIYIGDFTGKTTLSQFNEVLSQLKEILPTVRIADTAYMPDPLPTPTPIADIQGTWIVYDIPVSDGAWIYQFPKNWWESQGGYLDYPIFIKFKQNGAIIYIDETCQEIASGTPEVSPTQVFINGAMQTVQMSTITTDMNLEGHFRYPTEPTYCMNYQILMQSGRARDNMLRTVMKIISTFMFDPNNKVD